MGVLKVNLLFILFTIRAKALEIRNKKTQCCTKHVASNKVEKILMILALLLQPERLFMSVPTKILVMIVWDSYLMKNMLINIQLSY